ncbi:recombinase zinc beta ribbon domain-containing protein [Eubacteriales bacterium OttesenSCG-928-N14]|nr:recombinase zinc beta ribbon domain-containing protein [Eubacteriales bacterium OttesenSCG-928-N14]
MESILCRVVCLPLYRRNFLTRYRHAPASAKAPDEFILTTKLFCRNDGVFMVGTSGTSKTGRVYQYYKCGNAIYKRSCDKKAVRKETIERLVVEQTKELVLLDKMIDRIAAMIVELQKKENTVIPMLQKQLDDVNKAISNLLDAIQQGLFNASAKQRLDDLESRKADLEIAIAQERIQKPILTHDQIVFWISKFKDGDIDDPAYRKNIVDIFVNSVYLYDDKMVLMYNYRDGTKTVSLDQLQCSHLDDGTPPVGFSCKQNSQVNL